MLLAVRRHRAVEPMDSNWGRVVSEHAALVDAVAAKDPDAAADAARAHMISQGAHDTTPR